MLPFSVTISSVVLVGGDWQVLPAAAAAAVARVTAVADGGGSVHFPVD